MTVTIQGHTYEMGRKEFNATVNKIKKMIPKGPAILAIEKYGHAEMRNDVFTSQKKLTEAIHDWNQRGFLVKYTRGV